MKDSIDLMMIGSDCIIFNFIMIDDASPRYAGVFVNEIYGMGITSRPSRFCESISYIIIN